MIRRTVHYAGRVQGVGFRYTTCQVAADFPVVGYVKNLPDGQVEIIVEGEQADVDRFLAAVARDMRGAIRSTQQHESPASGEFQRFEVRF